MASVPSLAVAALVFTGNSVSSSRTSVTLSPVKMVGLVPMAWEPIAAPARWDTTDRTAR